VRVGGASCRAAQKVRNGERIEVEAPEPVLLQAEPQPLTLVVVYEDAHLVVVDKPAGLVVHPAPGHPDRTLVNALLHRCPDLQGIGGVVRPGIVHRIDRDTSGLLVVAKTGQAHEFLAALFKEHRIERRYRALVHQGSRLADRGTYRTLYGRHPHDRKRFSSKVVRGRSAVTRWQVVERLGSLAVVTVQLQTGRSHQIRVHFSEHGHPLVGDPLYGGARADGRLPRAEAVLVARLGRQALHAELLGFPHPVSGELLRFASPLPGDLDGLIAALRALHAGGSGPQVSGRGR